MNERKKFNFSTVLLYILLFIAMFALYYVGGNGEPFSTRSCTPCWRRG